MTTQEPRTGVQVEPLSEEAEELRRYLLDRARFAEGGSFDREVVERLRSLASKSGSETVPVVREGMDEAWAATVAEMPDGWNLNLYRFSPDYLAASGSDPALQYGATADRKFKDQPYLTVVSSGDGQPKGKAMYADAPTALNELRSRLAARLNEDARHGK